MKPIKIIFTTFVVLMAVFACGLAIGEMDTTIINKCNTEIRADVNGDGVVNLQDVSIVMHYNK